MAETERDDGTSTSSSYDAVIVGGSLAGCAAAIDAGTGGRARRGGREEPDPAAFKRICSHFIQASAVPTLERLGPARADDGGGRGALALRASGRRWGWIEAPPERAALGVNLRREQLDPLVRETAAATPGVELLLGRTVERAAAASGGTVERRRRARPRRRRDDFEAPLTIGADGRDSRIAELSGVKVKTYPHGRFAYGGYFEGAAPKSAPDASVWMMDPEWAAAFPTDDGLTFYAAMPTKDRLAEFKARPAGGAASPTSTRCRKRRRSAAGRAAEPRRHRQDRHDEPGAHPDRARPGADRRRGARDRPALRRRLRLGLPVGRMARRRGGAGAARRRGRSKRACAATGAATRASCAATRS